MAQFSTGSREDALDLVQEAMIGLAHKYSSAPAEDWAPLFYRILQNRIRDWHRKQKVRNGLFQWFGSRTDDAAHPVEYLVGSGASGPARKLEISRAGDAIGKALSLLPLRQQQAFMLRVWEGLSVAQTAIAMKCSEGSVKTHYSRAVHHLRGDLEDYKL